jgi:hypothetical protein
MSKLIEALQFQSTRHPSSGWDPVVRSEKEKMKIARRNI